MDPLGISIDARFGEDIVRAAFDRSYDAVVVTSADIAPPDLVVVYVNPAFTLATGYESDEVVGSDLRSLQGPKTDQTVIAKIRACVREGEPFEGEAILYRKDGAECIQQLRIFPMRDASGEIAYWVSILRDVTAARIAESMAAAEAVRRVASSLVSQLRLPDLAETAAEETARVARASACAFLYHATGGEGTTTHATVRTLANGAPATSDVALPPVDLAALFGGELILRGGAELAARFPVPVLLPGSPATRALAVGVTSRERSVVGAILLVRDDGPDFGDAETQIVTNIAGQCGVAIGNALLYERARHAEARLRRQVLLASTITTSLGEGVFALDAECHFTFANPAAEQILGCSFGDLVGGHVSDRVRLRVRSEHGEADFDFASVMRAGRVVRVEESTYTRLDGTSLALSFTAAPIVSRDAGAGVVVVFRDVTRQRRAERDWLTTVDAIADLILLEDDEGRVRRCNNAVREFFARDFREIVQLDIAELFFGSGEQAKAAFHAGFRADRAELQFPGHDGWYEVSSFPLYAVHDASGGWVHIVKDVTRRREQEAALRRLNAAIGQSAESIAIVDAGGVIRYVNPALEATTGYRQASVIGRDVAGSGIGPSNRREFRALRRTLLDGRVWNGSYASTTKEGTPYYADATISPVRGPSGEVVDYVVVFRDVTERKRYEAIAEAVNMMDNAGYIFSGIRHELGNPINSVKTALTVLKRSLDRYSRDTVENYVDRSLSEISRVEFLLKSLKTYSMHETPRIEPVPMAPFLEKFCDLVRDDFAARAIRVELVCAPDAGAALVDARALHQVLMNVFANAADALEDRASPTVRISLWREYGRIVMRVADNGIGFTKAQQVNLFKPFHTSKPHGTGLGLVIIKKLITKMHGTVRIDGSPGLGAEVTIVLEGAK